MPAPPSTETAQRCRRASGGVSRCLCSAFPGRASRRLARGTPSSRPFGASGWGPGYVRDTGGLVPTTIYVCVTCRAEGDASELRAGRRLHDAIVDEVGRDPSLRVVSVECLSVCRRPCSVGFAAPGKWTYVYGDLPADVSAPVLAEAARLYGAAPDGLIPWKLRADAIRKGVVARVPPLGGQVP